MLDDAIVSGKSIGGIDLCENVGDIIGRLQDDHILEQKNPNTLVVDGTISIFHDADTGVETSIACNKNFMGNFQNKLWPGMSVSDVLERSSKQIAWCGFVQVGDIKGIGLSLPAQYDDFEQITDFLQPGFVFDEL